MGVDLTADSHLFLNRSVTRLSGEEIDFIIHYWGTTVSRFEHPVHKHSFFEVCYVTQGEGVYMEEGRTFPLCRGTVFLSRPNKFHQIQYEKDMVMLFVGFEIDEKCAKTSALQEYLSLKETEHFLTRFEKAATTVYIWRALWEQAANPSVGFDSLTHQLAYVLLCSFQQTFTVRPKSKPSPIQDSGSLVYQARLFIQDNLSQIISATDVANYLYVSKRHLARLLAQEGESFTSYLRKKQIERAVHLLKNKDIPIKDIAGMAGFNSVHYFTKIFTKEMGASPARFRRFYIEG
jgi:AraC-like DNA-binding protein/mannose-6-phosphate isomerase-like protein (cupin superfamily)